MEFDLGIRCDYLMTMSEGPGREGVVRDGFIGIRGSQIEVVTAWTPELAERLNVSQSVKKMIHAKDHAVIPGLVNAHTHLAMTLLRGLADDLPFNDWLYKYILPTERKLVSPEFVRIGTELAALECIRAGTTTVCDMYFFGESVAQVLDQAGLRAMVSQALAIHPTPDNPDASVDHSFECLDSLRARYAGHPRITPVIAPHAPYSCTDEMLRRAGAYAARTGAPLVTHVSETRSEVEESLKTFGKTPVERLHDLGVMAGQAIFAHCVHVTEAEIDIMKASGASAIYNPESNMKLGSGIAPIPTMLAKGMKVGLGTDGAASNNDLSLFKEMDMAAKLQKLGAASSIAMTAHQALRLATIDGARALGLEKQTGSLEPGKAADIVLLNLRHAHLRPIHDLVSQLVYAATGQEVSTVICAGKILMENGRMMTLDPERVYAETDDMRDKIQASLRA